MQMNKTFKQRGFSLVELMVGLVIGLLVTLVITNVFTAFEQQKRNTTGSSDAQTNGAIALFSLQRDVQLAGYGLPVYGVDFSPFNCPINTVVDHDNAPGTPSVGLSPIVITDGAAGSDIISIRMGDSMKGGASVNMEAGTAANLVQVDNNLGCALNDIALVVNQPAPGAALNCSMTRVTAQTATGATPVTVTLNDTTNVAVGNSLSCMGVWNQIQYAVTSNQLTRTGAITTSAAGVRTPSAVAVPMISEIVNMQAQYGISVSGNSNQVTQWVDATGVWATTATTPSLADRNRIKAIRIAVVARNGLLERDNVTAACSSLSTANPTGLCAWDGSEAGSPAPAINLTADANWRRYRYRVYESIIPLRNVIWSEDVL